MSARGEPLRRSGRVRVLICALDLSRSHLCAWKCRCPVRKIWHKPCKKIPKKGFNSVCCYFIPAGGSFLSLLAILAKNGRVRQAPVSLSHMPPLQLHVLRHSTPKVPNGQSGKKENNFILGISSWKSLCMKQAFSFILWLNAYQKPNKWLQKHVKYVHLSKSSIQIQRLSKWFLVFICCLNVIGLLLLPGLHPPMHAKTHIKILNAPLQMPYSSP